MVKDGDRSKRLTLWTAGSQGRRRRRGTGNTYWSILFIFLSHWSILAGRSLTDLDVGITSSWPSPDGQGPCPRSVSASSTPSPSSLSRQADINTSL